MDEACKNGNLEKVQELVLLNIEIHANEAALVCASDNGHIGIIKYLVNLNADVNAAYFRILIGASKNGHIEVVKYLMELNINIYNHNKKLYWDWLISNKEDGIIQYLMTTIRTINNIDNRTYNNCALMCASENGKFDVVKYLIECNADIHAHDDYALIFAFRNNHIEIAKYLVEINANIHAQEEYLLEWASANNHIDIIEYLINLGANVSNFGLKCATDGGHVEVAKYLIDNISNDNKIGDDIIDKAYELINNYRGKNVKNARSKLDSNNINIR